MNARAEGSIVAHGIASLLPQNVVAPYVWRHCVSDYQNKLALPLRWIAWQQRPRINWWNTMTIEDPGRVPDFGSKLPFMSS